jgi:Ca-activated chloride channel family protein
MRWRATACLLLAGALTACVGGNPRETQSVAVLQEGDCIVVDVAVSSEKIDLLVDLAEQFNGSDEAEIDGRCVEVRPVTKASGLSTSLLAQGWPDPAGDGPAPVLWSPASSAWSAILNQRLAENGQPAMAPPSEPFMLSPLVIAMPRPMAEALGHPDEPIGWADVLALAREGQGWGAYGHPEWGSFRLGKTNPNFSTSGAHALLAQYYAATQKTEGLTIEDLSRPEVEEFARGVESAVVHYGDTTLTFLNNLRRAEERGNALTYASAVAVEEVSVINYNRGNPDGVLQPGEEPTPPQVPLVAVYPEEGTLFSDNPFVVLDAEWVDEGERAAAERFRDFCRRPENQRRVLEFGFRPGNPQVDLTEPITLELGVDPAQPRTSLEIPEPPVMVEVLDRWAEQRKPARVLLVLDVSRSMGDDAGTGDGRTKLELAQAAAIAALEDFSDADEVGLRVFASDLRADAPFDYVDLVPLGPIAEQREQLVEGIELLVPTGGTALYTATRGAFTDLVESFDQARINAVLLLSDGANDDTRNDQLDPLLESLRKTTQAGDTPVRVFPIAYGADADLETLRRIAEATDAAVYDASDPRSIDRVFTAVVSNF